LVPKSVTLDDLAQPKHTLAEKNKKTVLSQRNPRDAAVNFDTYRILRHHAVSLPLCHSTAFFYRPTSATVILRMIIVLYWLQIWPRQTVTYL